MGYVIDLLIFECSIVDCMELSVCFDNCYVSFVYNV